MQGLHSLNARTLEACCIQAIERLANYTSEYLWTVLNSLLDKQVPAGAQPMQAPLRYGGCQWC